MEIIYERSIEHYKQKFENIRTTPIRHPKLVCFNLGCGKSILENFVNIDKYFDHPLVTKGDIDSLPYDENTCDLILSSHSLEHMPFHVALRNIDSWYNWLKKGGRLCLAVPDLENQMRIMLSPNVSFDSKWGWYIYTIFGYQIDQEISPKNRTKNESIDYGQIHYCGFSKEFLIKYLTSKGYIICEAWTYDGWGTPSIYIEAIKP